MPAVDDTLLDRPAFAATDRCRVFHDVYVRLCDAVRPTVLDLASVAAQKG